MKTMCPPSYHHNSFAATHALGHIINHTSCAQVHELSQIYIYIYINCTVNMGLTVSKKSVFPR